MGPFFPNLSKNEFSGKRARSVFKYSNYLPSCKKSEKTNELFLRKTQTDGRMDRRPHRQTKVIFRTLCKKGIQLKTKFFHKFKKPALGTFSYFLIKIIFSKDAAGSIAHNFIWLSKHHAKIWKKNKKT